MSKIINVIIVVDTLSAEQGSPKVYMISDNPKDQSEGSPDLVIEANPGDYVHWRTQSVNMMDDVELLNFEKQSGDTCVENPYYSNLGWTTKVISAGNETYTFTFSVNGEGIFTWDPSFVVTPD